MGWTRYEHKTDQSRCCSETDEEVQQVENSVADAFQGSNARWENHTATWGWTDVFGDHHNPVALAEVKLLPATSGQATSSESDGLRCCSGRY